MKILQVFDFFSPHGGGTVDVVYKLSRALTKRGHEVTIYTSDYKLDREYINSLPEVNVRLFHCISSLACFYLTPGMVMETKRRLREFDIIHLHSARSFQNIVIHHYAKKYGIPYVLDTHGSLPRAVAGEGKLKPMLKRQFDIAFGNRILRDAHRLIAETEVGVKEYIQFGASEDNVALIPPPFDTEWFSKLPPSGLFRKKYGITEKKIVMFLGRINRIKGLSFLLESFNELSKLRDDAILVIVGNDDGYQSTLKSEIAELNLSDKVLFTGFLSGQDKLSALTDADVFVQTSIYEYGTRVTFEALLCDTPIIVTKNTSASENVKKINAGYLVEYGNKKELQEALQHVLDNPSEARYQTRGAKEYIKANLSLEKGIEKYEHLYTNCIAANNKTK
ncbi:MAG: glycosyltransferase [Dehalococcoidales bacterium]|nr:glycosyltransferase [Dehalococcoidales bacterium]